MSIRSGIAAAAWWLAGLGALLATTAWIDASAPGLPAFDQAGLILANSWRSPWLDAAFSGLTWLGSLMVLLPVVLATGVQLWRRGHRGEAGFVIAALAGGSLLAHLAKDLVMRPRPDWFSALTPIAEPFSFPSAHAAQISAAAVAVLLVVARLAPRCSRWAIPLLLSIVLLVDLSRLYLQVHFPSDVLAGTAAAVSWVFGLRLLLPGVDAWHGA